MGKPLSEEHKQKLREAARRRTPEQEARRIAALREAKKIEDPSYRQTDEYREKQRQATKKKWKSGIYEGRAEKTAATRANWTDQQRAELSRKMSEAKRQEWARAKAEGRRRNRHYGTRKRTSRHELALVPYMAAMGFLHDTGKRIGQKIPDFVNENTKQVYEYFGTYWHPDRDEERRTVEHYRKYGWGCVVLWETDLFDWLSRHQHLVTTDQHGHAWKIAHVNNGYQKPRPV